MKVETRTVGKTITITGLRDLARWEFDSVMRQVLEQANGDSIISMPECGEKYRYWDIANEATWGRLFEKIPGARASISNTTPTLEERLRTIDRDRAARMDPVASAKQMAAELSEADKVSRRACDAAMSVSFEELERRNEALEARVLADPLIQPRIILGYGGVQGIDFEIGPNGEMIKALLPSDIIAKGVAVK